MVHNTADHELANRPSTWKSQFDFVMSIFGMSVGLGNIWRFPYLCYKNGGGAFLIAYVSMVAVFGLPVIIMELAMGQYTRNSAVSVWKVVPLLKGVGYASYVVIFLSNCYYTILLAWSLRWFISSLSTASPWTECTNEWNSDICVPILDNFKFNESGINSTIKHLNSTSTISNRTVALSSVEEYWRNYILELSPSLEEYGSIKWDLALCLLAVWLAVYFSVWKGIGWTSKVVYVTATLPIAMILVVLVRGATLSGASTGIRKYLTPDLSKLGDLELWTDAANQVTFTFIIGYGCLISIASHNEYHYNILRNAMIVACSNALTSFTSGFAIFSILGHLAGIKNTTVDAVAESGPGLVFTVYPTALSLLPLPNLWMAIFFMTLILLGMDSVFVIQDGIFECTKDVFPWLFGGKWTHEVGHAIICGLLFVMGLSMVTNGGIYIFHIMNTYTCAGWCVFFLIFFELIGFAWIYDANRICRNMYDMMKTQIPKLWLIISLKYISPVVAMCLLVYSICQIKPLTYDRTYHYATWANVLAWISALSSVILIPITAVYVLWKTPGNGTFEKFRNSTISLSVNRDFAAEDIKSLEKEVLHSTADF